MTTDELKRHIDTIEQSPARIAGAVEGLDARTLNYKPAPGKWSILQILMHLADTEVVWAYRLRQLVAETNKPILAPVNQDDWVDHLHDSDEEPATQLTLYRVNRRANLAILRRVKVADLTRAGFHPEKNRDVPLGEFIEYMAKHDPHHLAQIEERKQAAKA